MKHRLTIALLVLAGVALSHSASAQIVGTLVPTVPITTRYSFKVPVAKVVTNPCATSFALVNGQLEFTIQTTDSGTNGFAIAIDVASSGSAEDALADGRLLVDGTQKTPYAYAYSTGFEAAFKKRPVDFGSTISILDLLSRGGAYENEWFTMNTRFDVNFVNGVPTLPTVKELTVSCPL